MSDGMRTQRRHDPGFTLIEVCIAMVVLGVAAIAGARLTGLAVTMVSSARWQTSTIVLADQKIEQLRSLNWFLVDSGAGLQQVSDTSSDTSSDPISGGGTGLRLSPVGTLSANIPGFVDYLDRHGQWAGNGASPPVSAVFVRRWSVAAVTGYPPDSVLLQVLVTTVARLGAHTGGPLRRLPGDALAVTVLSRKAR